MPDLVETPPPHLAEAPPAGGDPAPFDDFLKEINEATNPAPAPEPPPAKAKEETPPATVKKEEAPPAKGEPEEVEKPQGMSTKASENWDKLKESNRNYKAKVEAADAAIREKESNWNTEREGLLKQIEELSATTGELTELRGRKEAFDANEKEFSIYAVERTAEFQNTIVKPLQAIDGMLQQIAKGSGINYEQLADAVAESDFSKQDQLVEEFLPQLSELQRSRFLRAMEDARGLLDRRSEILQNAHAAQKELKERTERETTAQRETATKEFKASVKNAVESLAQRLPFVELVDGETKEGVFKSILDKVEGEDFDKATPATKGTAAVAVAVLERAVRQAQRREEYIKTLEARIAEGSTTTPALGGTLPPPEPAAPAEGKGLLGDVGEFLKLQHSHPVSLPQVL